MNEDFHPESREEAYALAETVASEIRDAFVAFTETADKSDEGNHTFVTVNSPSLAGHSRKQLNGLTNNFAHRVCFHTQPSLDDWGLRVTLVSAGDYFTGDAVVSAAIY